MLDALAQCQKHEVRDRLMAEAGTSAAALTKACKHVFDLPRGVGIQGLGFNLKSCGTRYRLMARCVYPDTLAAHPILLPRKAEFEEAYKVLQNAWEVLQVLLAKREGSYVRSARAAGEARGASGQSPQYAPDTGEPTSAGRGSGRGSGRGRARGRTPASPPFPSPPPPMAKTPVEIFLSIDGTADEGDDLYACVVSITASARQRPKAKSRRYVELTEKIRKDMALHLIDTATPHLLELAAMGRVGEFGLAIEVGKKMRKHHGQGGAEVLSSGNVDLASQAIEALLGACELEENEAASTMLEVHDKGDDRSKEECIGYAIKDMPEKNMPDGTVRPRAVQGKYHSRPKVFYWRGNISDERAEECIMEYRKNNQVPRERGARTRNPDRDPNPDHNPIPDPNHNPDPNPNPDRNPNPAPNPCPAHGRSKLS